MMTTFYPLPAAQASVGGVIELAELAAPVHIDLSLVFAVRGLNYQVACQCASVADIELLTEAGLLVLQASSYSRADDRTRLAVRATDEEGCSVLAEFDVVVRSDW